MSNAKNLRWHRRGYALWAYEGDTPKYHILLAGRDEILCSLFVDDEKAVYKLLQNIKAKRSSVCNIDELCEALISRAKQKAEEHYELSK